MLENLKITIVQSDLFWEDISKNLSAFSTKLESIKPKNTDIIVLPEMFSTGFTMDPKKNAETVNGKTLLWMKSISKEKNAVIVGSIAIKENGNYYNRLYWVDPEGKILFYNKRHLFRLAKEQDYYTAGAEQLKINFKGWKIRPFICYDLRFPVWSKNTCNEKGEYSHDVMIYIANWPEIRSYAWNTLLSARAIENQCYVIGVNRIGVDGKNISYSGDSKALDYLGKPIINIPSHTNSMHTVTLNYNELIEYREKFTVGFDWDKFDIYL